MLYNLIKYEYRQNGIEIVGFEGFPEAVVIPSEIEGIKVMGIASHSFKGLPTLKSLFIEDGLKYIGEFSFCDCTKLSDITLPDSIDYIGRDAFTNTYLYNHKPLLGGVLYIDRHLIKAKTPLARFTVNGVLSIAEEAFINQTTLKELYFTNQLRSISPRAFYNCGIKRVEPSYGVERIGALAFAECSNLEEATLPDSLSYIEEGIFLNTPLLDNAPSELYIGRHLIRSRGSQKVVLKNDTLSIAEGAFAESNIEWVDLRSITKIPDCCFYKCNKLKRIKSLPITYIGEGALAYCISLEKPKLANNAYLGKGYNYFSLLNWDIPDENILYFGKRLVYARELYGEYTVKYGTIFIEKECFKSNDRLTGVTFPGSVISIGEGAFLNCPFLKRLVLSDKLKEIPNYFAPSCELLEIAIPDSVKSIGRESFSGCQKLTGEVITSATKVGERAFYNTAITAVILKKPIKYIGKEGFAKSTSLKNISFEVDNNTILSGGLFKGCRSIVTLTLPEGLQSVPSSCFEGCVSLKEINLPSTIKSIGNKCFYDCKFLERINIPNCLLSPSCFENCTSLKRVSVNQKKIPTALFKNCTALEEVQFNEMPTVIGNQAFFGTTSLKGIHLTERLEIIGAESFKNSGIEEITLPDGIKIGGNAFENASLVRVLRCDGSKTSGGSIGEYAFYGCETLGEVDIPNGIYNIQKNCFSSCKNLYSVKMKEGLFSIGDECFSDCDKLKKIVIPDSVLRIGKGFFIGGMIYKKNLSTLLKEEQGGLLKLGGNIVEYEYGYLSVPLFGEECFSDSNWRKGSLSAYDSIFALDSQNKELKIDYVKQRLLYPYKLSSGNKRVFIEEYLDDIMFELITKQKLDDIRRLNENSCFSIERVQGYISYTTEIKAVSVTALLLDILRRIKK